jgi:hypothetical protein
MKYYKASVNVNLNWSKFNSLRANPSDPTNPTIDFIQSYRVLHRVTEDHLVHSLKFLI